MTIRLLAGAALFGLALARPVLAQTPAGTASPATVPVTGGVSNATTIPRLPAAGVPGDPGLRPDPTQQPGRAATPAGLTTPLYPHGVPTRDIDAGSSRAAQPRSGQATPGAQPTKSIFKGKKRRGE